MKNIKTFITKFLSMYGSMDSKVFIKNYILICLGACLGICIAHFIFLPIISEYFIILCLMIMINMFPLVFFYKNTYVERWKRTKITITLCSLAILLIIMAPVLLTIGCINCFADVTQKIYLLKKHPLCFMVEVIYHIGFVLGLVQQTILHTNNILYLLVTYVIFIVGDKLLCSFFRFIFIRGKYRHYERYCYSNEMNVVSEYLFLIITIISIICSVTEYEYVFIPILLLYSIKQIVRYRVEKREENIIIKFLLKLFDKTQEIEVVYSENIDGILELKKCFDYSEIQIYKAYNEKRPFWIISKYRVEKLINQLESFYDNKYLLPKQAEQIHNDMKELLNVIVKCI